MQSCFTYSNPLCAAVGLAADGLSSANVVGYISATIPGSGNKTFAVTLTDCANPGAPVRVDKLFTSDDFFGSGFDSADQIWRWDTTANGWAKYFYEKNGRGAEATYAWKKWDYAEQKVLDITDADAVAPGETFLFRRMGNAPITLTLSGQVSEFTATSAYSIPGSGNIFMAYPWPVEVKLADLQNLVTPETYAAFYGSGFDSADQIWRWDTTANGWAKYFYEKNGRGAAATYAWKKWNYAEGKVEDLTDADKLAPGEGFLFRRMGNATLTFTWKALEQK